MAGNFEWQFKYRDEGDVNAPLRAALPKMQEVHDSQALPRFVRPGSASRFSESDNHAARLVALRVVGLISSSPLGAGPSFQRGSRRVPARTPSVPPSRADDLRLPMRRHWSDAGDAGGGTPKQPCGPGRPLGRRRMQDVRKGDECRPGPRLLERGRRRTRQDQISLWPEGYS